MAHSIKLNYFESIANVDLTRFILAYTGTKHEEQHVTLDEWPTLREKINPPFGQLPVLEVDGVQICQSLAVARFAAKLTGLAGDCLIDESRAEMVVECISEIFNDILAILFFEQDPQKVAKLKETFRDVNLPKRLGYLENIFERNPGDWFIGKKMTWADLAIVPLFSAIERTQVEVDLSIFPKLTSQRQKIESIPEVKKYLSSKNKL